MAPLIGTRFGRLTVVSVVQHKWPSRSKAVCKCDCGNQSTPYLKRLLRGTTKSCGCLRKKPSGIKDARKSYWSMRQRCLCPYHPSFKYYGGRGITICQRWLDGSDFFLEDMGPRPPGTTLDRKNPTLGYYAANCQWIPKHLQPRNRRNVHRILYQGKYRSLTELADLVGKKRLTLLYRLRHGWTLEEAISQKVGSGRLH